MYYFQIYIYTVISLDTREMINIYTGGGRIEGDEVRYTEDCPLYFQTYVVNITMG
jgi:hypothetical protein